MNDYLELMLSEPELFLNSPEKISVAIETSPQKIAAVEQSMREKLLARGLPAHYAEVGIMYRDQYLMIVRDAVSFPDGSRGTYVRILQKNRHANAVILPKCGDNFVLVRHFRHATRSFSLEIPRGFGEPGISAEQNAEKEIREEIEGAIASIADMGVIHPDAGMTNNFARLFFAELVSCGKTEKREGISQICLLDAESLKAAVRKGDITDAYTVSAVAKAMLFGFIQ